jgi:hypothetical protein
MNPLAKRQQMTVHVRELLYSVVIPLAFSFLEFIDVPTTRTY